VGDLRKYDGEGSVDGFYEEQKKSFIKNVCTAPPCFCILPDGIRKYRIGDGADIYGDYRGRFKDSATEE
jgi:hypothetical protein